MSVAIPFGFDTESAVMQTIERTMNGPAAGDYYQAAVYYLNADKDINKAKTWIDKAIAMSEPAYWYYRQKALIYAKSGDKKGAIAAAERSMELAQAAGSQDYVAMNKKSLAEWTK
jgi:tetratricopeptide (TPR) repeat protein